MKTLNLASGLSNYDQQVQLCMCMFTCYGPQQSLFMWTRTPWSPTDIHNTLNLHLYLISHTMLFLLHTKTSSGLGS